MEYEFTYLGKQHKVKIEQAGDSKIISEDEKDRVKVELINLKDNTISFMLDGKVLTTYVARDKDRNYVSVDGTSFTGVVKRINFREGDQVDAFTPIVEAV